MPEAEPVPPKVRSIWPPVILFAIACGYTFWAQDYGRVPRLMPTVVGMVTAALAVLDLLSRFDNPVGGVIRLALGADFANPEMKHNPALRREAAIVGAMAGCVLAMLVIGILPTVPLFIALYMRFWGGRPWRSSLIAAVAVLVFVVAVFELALDYSLYRGVLFDGLDLFG